MQFSTVWQQESDDESDVVVERGQTTTESQFWAGRKCVCDCEPCETSFHPLIVSYSISLLHEIECARVCNQSGRLDCGI